MNKSIIKKIDGILEKNNITISIDSEFSIYINNIKTTNGKIKLLPIFSILKTKLKLEKDKDVITTIIDYCNDKDLVDIVEKIDDAAELIYLKEQAHKLGYILYDEEFSGDNEWKNNIVYKEKIVKIGKNEVKIKGEPINKAINYENYFTYCPKYAGKLRYNAWKRTEEFNEEPIEEYILRTFYSDIDNDLGINNRSMVDDAYYIVAHKNSIHTLQEYLKLMANLWDGEERIPTLFADKLKAEDTEYTRSISDTWFKGAVKRVFKEGCKNEVMIILVGVQGDGKNTLWERLFEKWGIELNIDISKEQDYGMKLDNCWCVVVDELADFAKKEASAYKKWISIREDRFRLPFEHKVLPHKRHNCYCGSTNDRTFLKDYTDKCERRYWVIECHSTKAESWEMTPTLTDEWVDQIWGEAAYKYFQDTNCPIDIADKNILEYLTDIQRKFKTGNEDGLWEELDEILNRTYQLDENGQFEDANDVINQIRTGKYVGDYGDKIKKYAQKINKIPSKYIKIILKNYIKDVRKHEYFEYWLKDWEVNVCDISLGTRVYKRKEPIYLDIQNNENQQDNEIGMPF